MITNTAYFSEAARNFKKYGRYTDIMPNTPAWFDFWDEETRRCEEGYTVGGVRITGYHYFYLNYSPILRIPEGQEEGYQDVQKVEDFPAFWDLDYEWFHVVEKAKKSGKHVVCLKTRGRGFSYKAASMGVRNYFMHKKSKNFYLASDKAYLLGDGVLTKCWDNVSFVNANTPWAKRSAVKDDALHKRASYLVNVQGKWIEKGYKSEIIGETLKNDPDKARGKRGELIFFEEAGSFPHLKKAWQIARPSVEQGKFVYGTLIAFGTGGEEGENIDGLDDMFYNPDAYNVLSFDNIWDEGRSGTSCSYFVPEYIASEGFMDSDGNSDKEAAKNWSEEERNKIRRNSKDPHVLDRYVAEHPFSPREALMRLHTNIFPIGEVSMHRDKIESTNAYKHLGVVGRLTDTDTGVVFQPDTRLKPVYAYPPQRQEDLTGAVVVYQTPFKVDGKVPSNLYIVVHDPYAFDKSTGSSIGAAYVIKLVNDVSKPDDMIVASYVARPNTQDEYNEILFKLARYYNAKICFENDRGEVIPFAKRKNMLQYLEEEPEIFDKDGGQRVRKLGRNYGLSMSNQHRKRQGEGYFRDWLLQPRGKTANGEPKLNLHMINDPGLLDEIIKYDADGNFDRVSAMIVGMFYLKHYETQLRKIHTKIAEDEHNSFFSRELFV